MAGHSKFKNIQHRKGAQDKKRGKIFSKLVKEIIVAVQIGGPDPSNNPRLRTSLSNARNQNLPKERIERAINQASIKSDAQNYTEIRYEGFVSGGIGIIIEVLTDNKNRSASEVRSALTKFGGALGENGSVSFMFDHVGCILYETSKIDQDKITEIAIELGCSDVETDENFHKIYTEVENFSKICEDFAKILNEPQEAYIGWKPHNKILIDAEKKEKLEKLLEVMDDCEDIQRVFTNADF